MTSTSFRLSLVLQVSEDTSSLTISLFALPERRRYATGTVSYAPTELAPLLSPPANLETLGRELGNRLLPPPVAERLVALLLQEVPGTGASLRLTFQASTPRTARELASLPWELAWSDALARHTGEGFLALHPLVRLIRDPLQTGEFEERNRPPLAETPGADALAEPLRILIASANPQTIQYPALLQIDSECRSMEAALQHGRSICLESLTDATPAVLGRVLRRFRPHLLHLIAHGERRPSGPALILQGEKEGSVAEWYGDELARLATEIPEWRMLVLSCCGTGETASLLASTMMAGAVPSLTEAVIQQFPLRDSTVPLWTRAFYSALATGESTEYSLWQARQALRGTGFDWAAATHWSCFTGESALHAPSVPTSPSIRLSPSLSRTSHNLPEEERPIIGRAEAIREVMTKLCDPAQRLVTITGIGGIGKSTLARACARRLLNDFPGGIHWIELEALEGREEIAHRLCSAWEVDPNTLPTVEESLLGGISGRPRRASCLVILDCFERHLKSVGLLEAVLRRIPEGITFLVTSRIVLGLTREFEYPLLPMATTQEVLPENDTSPGKAMCPLTTPPVESVQLFTEAAVHAQPSFLLTPANRAVVETICRRLEGVPLALTLAAGRLGYLSLSELLTQIESSPLRVLRRRGTGDTALDRHTALQDVIAGSFCLLPDAERHTLQQLQVFEGGFFLNDALAVCEALPGSDTLEDLGRLREHSLVQITTLAESKTRYRLLDTVREYLSGLPGEDLPFAREGFQVRCRKRHALHFAVVANEIGRGMRAGDWTSIVPRLRLEMPNLRRAVTYAIETEQESLILSFCDDLARPFSEAGYWSDFDHLTNAALGCYERGGDPQAYLRLLSHKALTARRRGSEQEARSLLERLREQHRKSGNRRGEADAIFELASQAGELNEWDYAGTWLLAARSLAMDLSWEGLIANTYALEAKLESAVGNVVAARTACHEAHRRAIASGDPDSTIYTGIHTGAVYMRLGDLFAAEAALRRAAEASLMGNRLFSLGNTLLTLAGVYEAADLPERAGLTYLAVDRLYANQETRRRAPVVSAFARFRRLHRKNPGVQLTFQSAKRLPGSEIVARLLAESPLGQELGHDMKDSTLDGRSN